MARNNMIFNNIYVDIKIIDFIQKKFNISNQSFKSVILDFFYVTLSKV